jgi:hypothetical protein
VFVVVAVVVVGIVLVGPLEATNLMSSIAMSPLHEVPV